MGLKSRRTQDLRSIKHGRNLYTNQVKEKEGKRLSNRSWGRQRIILKKTDGRCGVDSSGSVQEPQSIGIKIIN
jgi:hypothetical protein